MPPAPWVSVTLLTALLAAVSLAEPASDAFMKPLPLRLPDDTGDRIMQLRLYASDQCTSAVPRVTDAQLVIWAVARWEAQYLEQWVRVACVWL
jgi:hypothetical protein